MSKLFLVLSLLIFSVSVSAQSDSSSTKASYFLSIQSGGLLGKMGIGASLTTSFMIGIRFKRLSAAAGVGFVAILSRETRATKQKPGKGLELRRTISSRSDE